MLSIIVFSIAFFVRNALELNRAIRFKLGLSDHYRLTLVLLFLIYIFANLFFFYELITFQIQTAIFFWAGLSLYTLAFVLREAHSWMMNQAYSNTMTPQGPKIVKKGLFQIIRHPLYFLYSLELFSFFVMSLNILQLPFLGLFYILLLIRIQAEESYLVQKFGSDYIEYQKATKKLIPFVY